jgi:hypothetical protein
MAVTANAIKAIGYAGEAIGKNAFNLHVFTCKLKA